VPTRQVQGSAPMTTNGDAVDQVIHHG
jgi:hypothetical protein